MCYTRGMCQPYQTVQAPASAALVVERSRFIGHCLEVADEPAAKDFILRIRAEHAQANHNCYAYRIGSGAHLLEYFNDHGEPSGTAGKPILGAIQRRNLTNVVVVVTRYFGGKKLGVRGLIEAYGQAATAVLAAAGAVTRIPRFRAELRYGYADHALILHRLQQVEAEVIESLFAEAVTTRLQIPAAQRERFQKLLAELPVTATEIQA